MQLRESIAPRQCNQSQCSEFSLSCCLRFLFIPQQLFLTLAYQQAQQPFRQQLCVDSVFTCRLWRGTPFRKSAANLHCISRPGPVGVAVRDCHQIWASEGRSCDWHSKMLWEEGFGLFYFRRRPPVFTCWEKGLKPWVRQVTRCSIFERNNERMPNCKSGARCFLTPLLPDQVQC